MANATTATFDTQGNKVTLASPIGSSTSAALVKIGSGILTLSANNTFTGGTTVSTGTLALTADNTAFNTSQLQGVLTVQSGAATLSLSAEAFGYGGSYDPRSPWRFDRGGRQLERVLLWLQPYRREQSI